MKAILFIIGKYWRFKTKHMVCANTAIPKLTGVLIGPDFRVLYLIGEIHGAQHSWYPNGFISPYIPEFTITHFIKF